MCYAGNYPTEASKILLGGTCPRLYAGVLSGCGRQTWCACANITCFWVLGLPLSWLLGLHMGFGLDGLWAGIAVGSLAQVRQGSQQVW